MYLQRSKWGRAKKTTYNGKAYDSKFEASYAKELELRKRAGEIKDFETHKALDLIVNGFIVAQYKVDFVVYHHDGLVEYVETKGFPSRDWVLRWKILEAMMHEKIQNGEVALTLVRQKRFNLRRVKKLL